MPGLAGEKAGLESQGLRRASCVSLGANLSVLIHRMEEA